MADEVTGACLCKAITYKAAGPPLFRTLCHCYNCRKVGGGVANAADVYTVPQVTFISGEDKIRTYEDKATDSTSAYNRLSCSTCGSQVGGKSALVPNFIAMNAGSLDPEYVNLWRPDVEQYCQTKCAFLPVFVGQGVATTGDRGKGLVEGSMAGQVRGRYVRHMAGEKVAEGGS